MSATLAPDAPGAAFDLRRCFVRITRMREDGFVEFEFALGAPEVFIEMILSREAFADFCRARQPESLASAAEASRADGFDWRLSDARERRLG